MKRAIYIVMLILFITNLSATIHLFRTESFNRDFWELLSSYGDVSIYALKLSIVGVIFDYLSKDWFKKDKKNQYVIEFFSIDKTTQCSFFENVLSYIPINNWDWYLYEINAIDNGKSPIDLNALNKELDSLVEGYHISWEELKELLTSLVEIKNCLIVALNQKEDYQDVAKEDFVDFLCLIRIKDRNSCEIKLNKSLIEEEHNSDQI